MNPIKQKSSLEEREFKGYEGLTPSVEAMRNVTLFGSVIPLAWRSWIRRDNGRVYPVAKDLLAEIVYWHKPRPVEDKKRQIIGWRRAFKADKLQKSYEDLANDLGYTKRQIADAAKWLESHYLVSLEFRTVNINGHKLGNVLFWNINVPLITAISFNAPEEGETLAKIAPSYENSLDLLPGGRPAPVHALLQKNVRPSYENSLEVKLKNVRGQTKKRKTNTDNTQTTPNNTTDNTKTLEEFIDLSIDFADAQSMLDEIGEEEKPDDNKTSIPRREKESSTLDKVDKQIQDSKLSGSGAANSKSGCSKVSDRPFVAKTQPEHSHPRDDERLPEAERAVGAIAKLQSRDIWAWIGEEATKRFNLVWERYRVLAAEKGRSKNLGSKSNAGFWWAATVEAHGWGERFMQCLDERFSCDGPTYHLENYIHGTNGDDPMWWDDLDVILSRETEAALRKASLDNSSTQVDQSLLGIERRSLQWFKDSPEWSGKIDLETGEGLQQGWKAWYEWQMEVARKRDDRLREEQERLFRERQQQQSRAIDQKHAQRIEFASATSIDQLPPTLAFGEQYRPISSDFRLAHPELSEDAIELAWRKAEIDRMYRDYLYTHLQDVRWYPELGGWSAQGGLDIIRNREILEARKQNQINHS